MGAANGESMYYLVISAAVTMFGVQFFFNERYTNSEGAGMRAVLRFTLCANAAGAVILSLIALIQSGFRLPSFSFFTLGIAAAATLNGFLYNFCSFQSLAKINLSLYSVFAMLGGMTLPFVSGILFFHEDFTLGKGVCFAFIALALSFTVEKGQKRGGWPYYLGIFIFNGMSGVLTKIYQYFDVPKTPDAYYSVTLALLMTLTSAVLLLFNKEEKKKPALRTVGYSAGYGILSTVANFLLLLSLSHLPASAQYPFVTGGVMIVSTVLCLFTPNKPKKKDLLSVALAFAGIMALVFFE